MAGDKMNLLLVGGGGRECALARALSQSPRAGSLYAAPGNPGTARYAENVPIAADDVAALVDFANSNDIGLAIIGPEKPLVLGVVDALQEAGIACAGPSAQAARLEGSKVFAKQAMTRLGIAQAEPYGIFDTFEPARRYIEEQEGPLVVKADGLAAGKGVIVTRTRDEAIDAAREMLVEKRFGAAGNRIVVEPCLEGEEVSLLFVTDGTHALPLAPARDYKRLGMGDTGPNTGGMGAHSPGTLVTPDLLGRVHDTIVTPLLEGMAREGTPYRGILYCGLMITKRGAKVLEFNCRFGDPETQVILPRLRSCLVSLLHDAACGTLEHASLSWDERAALCIILASDGYPMAPRKGYVIKGLEALPDGVIVDHAGTRVDEEGALVTSGGRVLSIGALGATVAEARDTAYSAVSHVTFDGMYFRRDIGGRVRR